MAKINKIVSFLFVALFINYYVSTTFFSHLHIINGTTVAHSHTHTDSHHDTKSGGHTQNEIILIAQISHFDYTDFSCICILKPLQLPLCENKCIEITHNITSTYLQNLSLRAPPVFI